MQLGILISQGQLLFGLKCPLIFLDLILRRPLSQQLEYLLQDPLRPVAQPKCHYIGSRRRGWLLHNNELGRRSGFRLSLGWELEEDHEIRHQLFGLELEYLVEHEEAVLVLDVGVDSGHHGAFLVDFGGAATIGALAFAFGSPEELLDPMRVPIHPVHLGAVGAGGVHITI